MFEGAGPAELEAAATREEDAAVEQVRGLLKQRGVPEPKWLESATLLKPAGAAGRQTSCANFGRCGGRFSCQEGRFFLCGGSGLVSYGVGHCPLLSCV